MSAATPIETRTEPAAMATLASLARGAAARIVDVVQCGQHATRETVERLHELGFVPGERVHVLARGPFGGEPIAVRVGASTFALRCHEAGCILVARLD